MKRKIFILLILFLMCKDNVLAVTYRGCDSSMISRLKSLVSNVNLSYDYRIVNNASYFDVTITNIPDGTYFVDSSTQLKYNYLNTQKGEITIKNYDGEAGRYVFYSNAGDCVGVTLGSKYYSFPVYNPYHNHSLCSDIPNFSLCQKWVNKVYPLYQFENKIEEYKSALNNKEVEQQPVEYEKTLINIIIDFYVRYYYLILGSIVILCWIIIMINRKRNKFKL